MRYVAFAGLAFVLVAGATPAKNDLLKVMHERHEGMEAIGKATKTLRRELQGSAPNATIVRRAAAQTAQLARDSSGWFPKGSGPETGKTAAKPEIWQDTQDFGAKLTAFQKSAGALNAAAAGGDMSAAKVRFADLGQTCKACHDRYRSEMHH